MERFTRRSAGRPETVRTVLDAAEDRSVRIAKDAVTREVHEVIRVLIEFYHRKGVHPSDLPDVVARHADAHYKAKSKRGC